MSPPSYAPVGFLGYLHHPKGWGKAKKKKKTSHISLCALFPDGSSLFCNGGLCRRAPCWETHRSTAQAALGERRSRGQLARHPGVIGHAAPCQKLHGCTAGPVQKPLPAAAGHLFGAITGPGRASCRAAGSHPSLRMDFFFPKKSKKQQQRLHLLGARRAGNHEPPPGAARCWRAATRQRAGSNPSDFTGRRRGKRRWCFEKSQEGEAELLPPALLLLWFLSPSYPARCHFKYLQLATKPCKVGKRVKYCLFLLLMQSLND